MDDEEFQSELKTLQFRVDSLFRSIIRDHGSAMLHGYYGTAEALAKGAVGASQRRLQQD